MNPLVSLQDNLNQPENRQVMSYRTNSGAPQDFYLRILALDQFNGSEWRPSTRRLKDVPKRLPAPEGLGPDVAVTEITSNISASRSYQQTYLPLPYPATEVGIDGRWRYEPEGRTLVGDRGETTRGAQYRVSSLVVEPTAEQLASAGPAPAGLRREYTRVPGSLPKVVEETANRVTQGAANDYERAVKLQTYFASDGGFSYNTSVNSGTGSAAITRFLKEKQGFCVHFSFTMAAMARTLGIPARVAVGFTPGTGQPDGSVSVGLRDAHAWPELYFEGVGWTRFEPTPTRGTTPPYTQQNVPTGDTDMPALPEKGASAAPSTAPSVPDSCPAQMRKQGECGSSAAAGVKPPTDSGTPTGTVIGVVLLAVVLLALPLLPLLWRLRARRRRLGLSAGRTPVRGRTAAPPAGQGTTGSDRGRGIEPDPPEYATARALAAWQEITDTAWDHGIEPDDSRTPRKAADRVVRLGQLGPDAADAVHRVAGAVEQVLYAPEPRGAPASPRTWRRYGPVCGRPPAASPGSGRSWLHARPFGWSGRPRTAGRRSPAGARRCGAATGGRGGCGARRASRDDTGGVVRGRSRAAPRRGSGGRPAKFCLRPSSAAVRPPTCGPPAEASARPKPLPLPASAPAEQSARHASAVTGPGHT